MTGNDEALPAPRRRTLGVIHAEGCGALIAVDHLYAPEGAFSCEHCGEPGHDPGMVSLFVDEDTEDDSAPMATALLTAGEALTLANRLQRAASLILESGEDRPDVEREAARFTVPDDASGAQP